MNTILKLQTKLVTDSGVHLVSFTDGRLANLKSLGGGKKSQNKNTISIICLSF